MENKQTPKKKLDNQITDKDESKANNNKISSPKDKVKNSISSNKSPQKNDIKNEQKKNDDENDFLLPVKTIKKNKLGKSVDTNKNSEINIGNYNKDKTNSINNLILLDGVKSNYILTKLTQNLSRKTLLNMIRYNKQLQRKLNIELKDYEAYLQTEIELNFVQSYSNLEPINFINYVGDKNYYHIFYNDSEQEGKKEENIRKIRIIIDRYIKSFKKLFYRCEAKEINIIKCNRKDIINMNSMFKECRFLKKLNISNLETEKVTNMGEMFSECSELKELDVSKFNTSNVKDMHLMFGNCKSLEQLDLQNFNTSKVNDMSYMFSHCTSLKKINLENFNTKNVINMEGMFFHCYSLIDVDISKFNFENFPIVYSMFAFCLKYLKHKISNQVILKEEAFY